MWEQFSAAPGGTGRTGIACYLARVSGGHYPAQGGPALRYRAAAGRVAAINYDRDIRSRCCQSGGLIRLPIAFSDALISEYSIQARHRWWEGRGARADRINCGHWISFVRLEELCQMRKPA